MFLEPVVNFQYIILLTYFNIVLFGNWLSEYSLLYAVFPVPTFHIKKAFLGFCKSIHYVDASGKNIV